MTCTCMAGAPHAAVKALNVEAVINKGHLPNGSPEEPFQTACS